MRTIDIKLPSSWMDIPGDRINQLSGLLQNPDSSNSFLVKAFLLLSGIRPMVKPPVMIDEVCFYWFRMGKSKFLLSTLRLTDAAIKLSHLLNIKGIPVTKWKGSSFWFRPPVYGLYRMTVQEYLNCENHFSAYTSNGDEKHLVQLALNLWIPRWFTWNVSRLIRKLNPEVKSAIGLFYIGSRAYLAEQFPNLFKPMEEGSDDSGDITQLIRALNNGDVTRNDAILKVQLWDALKQLEEMAIQAEQIKQSMKK
jgi:hypothetical protein